MSAITTSGSFFLRCQKNSAQKNWASEKTEAGFTKKSLQEETDCLIKVLFNAPTFGAVHSGGAGK